MNEIQIYLKTSGSIAELYKDFNLYQDSYQNTVLSIYVPKAILYESVEGDFVTAVKTGAFLTEQNGVVVTTKSFYADYVKDVTLSNQEYSVYSQPLPKEYLAVSGTQKIIVNVVNMDVSDEQNPRIISVVTSQVAQFVVLESSYLSQDEILSPTDLEEINARLNYLENKIQNKVLVDFTVNSQTGQGIKYYSDGSIAQIQFPMDNPNVIVSSDLLQVLAFNSTSFVLEDDGSYSLAFGPAQTNMTNNNFFVGLTKTGTETYKSGVETAPAAKQGEYTLCDTVFKGTDGSVYLTATEPYSGRLLLLSGMAFVQKVVSNVTYANSLFTVTYTDGTNSTLDISGKLNQIESDIPRLYSTIPGNPNSAIGYAATPNAGTIAQRTLSGTVQTANGVENLDAANYGQVMELINGIQLVKINDLQYQLTVNGQSAGTINIPQDQFLKSVTFDPETNILTFVFTTSEGDVTTEVDMSDLVDVYTAGNGLNLANNEFSVKLDGSANNALKLTANGLFVDKTQFESAAGAAEKWEQQSTVNAGKLDKVMTTGSTQVYAVNSQGEQTMLQASSETPESNNIPVYNADGNLVSQDLAENASSSVLTPKGYVDNIKTNLEKQLSSVPRTAVNGSATSGESVTVPNTPQTQLNAQDYGTIFTHKRLWNGALYDEGFNQLLNPQNYPATTTKNGITFTNNGDGTITVSGTATAEAILNINYSKTLTSGKYLLQGCPQNGSSETYRIGSLFGQDIGAGVIGNVSGISTNGFTIQIASGYVANNLIFKPQLVDLTAFENATGNTIGTVSAWNALYPDLYPYVPTVSPDTPLEIVPSGSQSRIVSSGKNLFTVANRDDYLQGLSFTENGTNSFMIKCNAGYFSALVGYVRFDFPNLPAGEYTVSFIATIINSFPSDKRPNFIGVQEVGTKTTTLTYQFAAGDVSNKQCNYTFTKTYNDSVIRLLFYSNATTADTAPAYQGTFENVQLESGNVVTPYAPYVAPITTEINYTAINSEQQSLIYNAVTLSNFVSERNGNVVTVKNGKIVLNGTENWTVFTTHVTDTMLFIYLSVNNSVNYNAKNEAICTHFPFSYINSINDNGEEAFSLAYSTNYLYLSLLKSRLTSPDLAGAKAYISAQYAAGTPITVYYAYNSQAVEIEEIAPIPTFGDNNTTFTSEAIGTVNAPVIMDFTTYIANNLPKGYALLKDNAGNLIVAYTQTNMLYDVNTDKYMSDLINLKDTVTGTIYKLTVTNGAIALVEFTN